MFETIKPDTDCKYTYDEDFEKFKAIVIDVEKYKGAETIAWTQATPKQELMRLRPTTLNRIYQQVCNSLLLPQNFARYS